MNGTIYGGPLDYDTLYAQLKDGRTLADRRSAADSLRGALQDYPLDGVIKIWYAGKDLVDPHNPVEVRHTGFELLTACVKHEAPSDLERREFFNTLTASLHPDDFHLQLAAMVELAKSGKDLSGFSYETLPLLTRWLHQAYEAVAAVRQPKSTLRSLSSKLSRGEAVNLHQVFNFVDEVIKFSSAVCSEEQIGNLLDETLFIAYNTSDQMIIHDVVRVFDQVVVYSTIPSDKLPKCIKVLCTIHNMVTDARKEAWHTVRNLCRSHNGSITVGILLDILQPESLIEVPIGNTSEMRGALAILEKLVSKARDKGYPRVPFALLMEALTQALTVQNVKVEADILKLISSLFNNPQDGVLEELMEEDWTTLFQIAKRCSLRASENADNRSVTSRPRATSPARSEASTESSATTLTGVGPNLQMFIGNIEKCINLVSAVDFLQKENCISFLAAVHPYLSESCADLVIDHYAEYRLCYPSDPNWRVNLQLLREAFFSNRSRSTEVRLHALRTITDVYDMVELLDEEEDGDDSLFKFVAGLLADLAEERDVLLLQEIVSFAVSVAHSADVGLYEYIIKQLHFSISSDQLHSPLSGGGSRISVLGSSAFSVGPDAQPPSTTPASVIARVIIQMFMRSLENSGVKALRAFDEIVWIAKANSCHTDARLSAIRLLFHIRADWAGRIFLTSSTESEGLAAALLRTSTSLERKQAAEEAGETHGGARPVRTISSSHLHANMGAPVSRTVSGPRRAFHRSQYLWMYPDTEALPKPASGQASATLISSLEEVGNGVSSPPSDLQALNISAWLEMIMNILQQGCDWEIYAYILVHLPSQLSNQALFRAAIPQIKSLRALLCQLIKGNSFYEPPQASGLRKADAAICLFEALNSVMSYHRYFMRNDEDEIIKTFIHGMQKYETAAKFCIHALSICCHELPDSMKGVLQQTLQEMTRMITRSHVAMHILEFLTCLARLPKLHSNFREEDYRVVFAICFRYLQTVREKEQDSSKKPRFSNPQPSRSNVAPTETTKMAGFTTPAEGNLLPNASDDLPQYVHSLAYHVITFWFLSLRLSLRGNQVSWITKNLVWQDQNGRQHIDEQAQVTMNFIRRTAYADVDESAADPNFTPDRFGEIMKRRWLLGQSIITIEQATRGGWAQITKRQASGTSHYMICEKFERPLPHQVVNTPEALRDTSDSDPNVVQPSHLLVQLVGPSLTASAEKHRPIPLPDDDKVRRAITTFDRIPTVDCHKVGVIYIGENQTTETEILANTIGSSEYTEFLSGLGTLAKLQGATFNTQGLDRQYNTDGEYTYCWRDRVTEIVFHVTTLMPTNLDHDPQCANKKRHIGNDFVNIIFNNSGHPFRFDTFPSDFNFVNIVITPESRASFIASRSRSAPPPDSVFYKVQVMSKPGFPEISPAAETKLLSFKALPDFIRLLALNASVFSLVWANRTGGEYMSSWRSRLKAIDRMREQYGPKSPTSPTAPAPLPTNMGPGSGMTSPSNSIRDSASLSLRRGSVATFLTSNTSDTAEYQRNSKHLSTAETEVGTVAGLEESMVEALDFSKWA
jgi:hypothetical protein